MLEDDAPLAGTVSLSLTVSQDQRPNPEDIWRGDKNECLKDVFRQVDSSAGQHMYPGLTAAAIANLVKEDHRMVSSGSWRQALWQER